jgi:hypothetical protein
LPNTEGTNYCGSDSVFEKGYGSGSGSRQNLAQFFNSKQCVQILPLNVRSSIVSQKVGLFLIFFTFVVHFKLDPGPNPVPQTGNVIGTGMLSDSGSAKAKSCGSCGSGSTTLA